MNAGFGKFQNIKAATTAFGILALISTRIYAVVLNEEAEPVEEAPVHGEGAEGETLGEGNFYINLGVVVFCTCAAGMMSGLTIGLAAIDRLSLEVDSIGNIEIQHMTKRIFPVIDQHHWMLVTLLLCNAGAMETLPIFLDRMVPPVAAIVISVTLILIFGEVIPQAICTGPKQLTIAYWMCPMVLMLMWLTSPVSWPIAKFLDIWLGEHTLRRFDNNQLTKLVKLHSVNALKKVGHHLPDGIDGLTYDQARMIEGAITFHQDTCEEIMTKIARVNFVISLDQVITNDTLRQIRENGYSRIPVVESQDEIVIIAFLLTKSLVGLDTSQQKTLAQLYKEKAVQIKVPLYLHQQCTLGRCIRSFQTGHSHMAIICESSDGASELREYAEKVINKVTRTRRESTSSESSDDEPEYSIDFKAEVIGIVTLENVIERILLSEIHDERDREEVIQLLKTKPTIMFKQDETRALLPTETERGPFKNSFVEKYYNGLLDEVQRSIALCTDDRPFDEVKINVGSLSKFNKSASRSAFQQSVA